jgi:hypothetical protein
MTIPFAISLMTIIDKAVDLHLQSTMEELMTEFQNHIQNQYKDMQ